MTFVFFYYLVFLIRMGFIVALTDFKILLGSFISWIHFCLNVSFTVNMLSNVPWEPKLGRKGGLFCRTITKTLPSLAFERGIVKINLQILRNLSNLKLLSARFIPSIQFHNTPSRCSSSTLLFIQFDNQYLHLSVTDCRKTRREENRSLPSFSGILVAIDWI